MKASGRDGNAYLVTDGPVGAIVGPGLPVHVLPVASILAHREFDPSGDIVPSRLVPDTLEDDLAAARRAFEESSR